MVSLYIHVPFCDKKCGYCSFFVVPKEGVDPQGKLIEGYMSGLLRDIQFRGEHYKKPPLKTLYLGGGTPGILGKEKLITIITAVQEYFDTSYLEELSIELNPNPYDEILDLVDSLNKQYPDFPRIRYSFGIQSFDDDVLSLSWRQYSFAGIQNFIRSLRSIKEWRNIFNFDFIAFGKGERTKDDEYLFWDRPKRERFQTLVESGFADSFSLYTLELFGGAKREKTKRKEIDGQSHLDLTHVPFPTDQEKITAEHQWLKEVLLESWFNRYELSNFSYTGKESIHNMIYRKMENYLGLWPSAASFLTGEYATHIPSFITTIPSPHGVRFTQSPNIFGYTKEQIIDPESIITLDEKEFMIEKVFLALRTRRGVNNFSSYKSVLVENREALISHFRETGLLSYENDKLTLTDEGLDVYNSVVSELLAL